MSKLRVGVAGAGWVSPYHLEAWKAAGRSGDRAFGRSETRAEVVAIADPDRAAAEARASEFGIAQVYSDVADMLDDVDLDAIDIAAPREAHVPICRLAAEKRLAILCQKPLAPTLAEAEALVADLAGSRLMVHENWRFRPHYRQVRDWLLAGQVGEVQAVTMSILTSGLLRDQNGELPALVRQPMLATLDRMLLMEVMIHHVDTLRFLLGELVLETAELRHRCTAIRGEDYAALQLRTMAGAPISLVGDFMVPGQPAEQFDELRIQGTRGSITLQLDQLLLSGAGPIRLDLPGNYRASYRGAIEHFVECLRTGREFETNPIDNLETLRIVEAAYARGE